MTTDASLSSRLRAETKDAHVAAERSGIMRSILRGTIEVETYVVLLRNLAAIYRAMEQELERHAALPALAAVNLGALRRLDALERDIDSLDPEGAVSPSITPAAKQYVARLHHLGEASPELLLAHAYVRYMGDLSGGKMLRGMVAKAFGLPDGVGTAFYEFPRIPDADAFKDDFRRALDDAGHIVSPDAIVSEAQRSFELHQRLFSEIE